MSYDSLRIWAESYEDAQRARISCFNRLTRVVVPDPFVEQLDLLKKAELALKKQMRDDYRQTVPAGVIAWQETSNGIGEHLLSRLLGVIGDPVNASPAHWEGTGAKRKLVLDAPFKRRVSDLWSYCGHGDASLKRKKGMTVEDAMKLGSPRAKMLVHLMSEGAMKWKPQPPAITIPGPGPAEAPLPLGQSNVKAPPEDQATAPYSATEPSIEPAPALQSASWRYRPVYDLGKATYAERVDQDGKPWTDGHKHAAALRLVGKHILRDLWVAAGG